MHRKKSQQFDMTSRQGGFVLITGLVFLVVLTLLISFGLKHSRLEYKMSKNAAENLRAFNNSDGARTVAVKAFEDYAFTGHWVDEDTGTAGMQPEINLEITNTTRNMMAINPSSSTLTDHSTLGEDLDSDGELDPDMTYTLNDHITNIYVMKTFTRKAPGCAAGFAEGGSGSGSGAGCVYALYEMRADGQSADSAESMTAADLRYFVN